MLTLKGGFNVSIFLCIVIKQVFQEQNYETKDDGVGTTYSYNIKGQVAEEKYA